MNYLHRENCVDYCPYISGGECSGECMTIKPIEVLNDADLERGASPSLVVIDEPKQMMNGNW